MRKPISVAGIVNTSRVVLSGPQALAFVPAICLGAFWLGGEVALLGTALGLPLAAAITGLWAGRSYTATSSGIGPSGQVPNDVFEAELQGLQTAAQHKGEDAACVAVALDDYAEVMDLHGHAAANHLTVQFGERILSIIRSQDLFTQIGRNKFLIGLAPSPNLDLEACIQMAGRIHSVIEEPVMVNGTSVYLTCCVGFCQKSLLPDTEAAEWIDAATAALCEAQRSGPSTIRAYSSDTRRRSMVRVNLRKEFETALDNGQIRPWFQPQISTDTGDITGFEALARWEHPTKGVLAPGVFLPFAEQAELMDRLGQAMRHHAFEAMCAWEAAGQRVPRIGVNFSSNELRNPGLIDRLKWELDQFDLTPDRLAVEILETVFSRGPEDVITRNVTGLASLGSCIDLDDFGTGHASIASIKRFNVSRLKIDRTFVAKSDQDPGQQQLVSAILTMAERLNLETLAEGVESPGEHALMAQLGCNHVQGFGIGKPMPFDKTQDWISAHRNNIKNAPKIGRKTG